MEERTFTPDSAEYRVAWLKAMKGEEAGEELDAMVGKVIRRLEPRIRKFKA